MIRFTEDQVRTMLDRTHAESPRETCGMLSGRIDAQGDAVVEKVYPIPNIDRSSVLYEMEPMAQASAFADMDSSGTDLVGIYHSHPLGSAYPSGIDSGKAYYPHAHYVLCSTVDRPPVRAYRIVANESGRGKTVTEQVVVIAWDDGSVYEGGIYSAPAADRMPETPPHSSLDGPRKRWASDVSRQTPAPAAPEPAEAAS